METKSSFLFYPISRINKALCSFDLFNIIYENTIHRTDPEMFK